MLVQLFERGRGRGSGPVQYTTKEVVPAFDAKGRPIPGKTKTRVPPPEVLRGDPDMVERLIDSSSNEWKYSSGVVAFGNTDSPTEDEVRDVMDDFEKTFFAGLEPDQYSCLWVRHTHEGNTELHFVIPRLELSTGKALNPFPPGHMKMSDAWRDKWNHEKGWERPDDPARMRLVKRPGHELKLNQSEDPRGEITAWLVDRIVDGQIENRADLVASLSEIGEVTRQGKDYVSVRPEGFAKALRLKGAIYGQDLERERFIREIEAEDGGRLEPTTRIDIERAREAAQRLKPYVDARAEYNAQRYSRESQVEAWGHGDADGARGPDSREDGRRPSTEIDQGIDRTLRESIEVDQAADGAGSGEFGSSDSEFEGSGDGGGAFSESQPSTVDSGLVDRTDSLADHLRRQLGPAAIFVGSGSTEPSHHRPTKRDDPAPSEPNPGSEDREHQVGNVSDTSRRRPRWLHNWRHACDQVTRKLKDGYDRIRAAVIAGIERVERAVQAGYDAARRAEQSPERASERLIGAGSELERSAQPVRAFLEKLGGRDGQSGVDEIAQALQMRQTDSGASIKPDAPVYQRGFDRPKG